jgi:hypothetical protein
LSRVGNQTLDRGRKIENNMKFLHSSHVSIMNASPKGVSKSLNAHGAYGVTM